MNPTRRDFLCGGLALAALPAKAHLAFADATATRNTRWLEALPICNGRIGGMVFGGIHKKERIALTESTGRSGASSSSARTWRSIRSTVGSSPGRLTRRRMPFAHQPEDTATNPWGQPCDLVLVYARFSVPGGAGIAFD
jgi:Glycosyl hydrolase family 65, N-terminal domain